MVCNCAEDSMVFKRPIKTYQKSAYAISVLLLIIGVFFYLFYEFYNQQLADFQIVGANYWALFVFSTLVLGILSVFSVKGVSRFLRATSVVQIDSEAVLVGENIYPIKDIEQINLAAIGYIGSDPYYGAFMLLKNGQQVFVLGDEYLRNDHKLFQTLSAFNLSSRASVQQAQREPEELPKKTFSFHLLSSIEHVVFLMALLLGVFAAYSFASRVEVLFFISFLAVLYYLIMDVSYYFILSEDKIIVKNKIQINYSKTYELKGIQGVMIHQKRSGKSSRQGLRIINGDFKTALNSSNGLSWKKWDALSDSLKLRGVEVFSKQ